MKPHLCPSTRKTSGPCKAYVVDHVRPLKRGGADTLKYVADRRSGKGKGSNRVKPSEGRRQNLTSSPRLWNSFASSSRAEPSTKTGATAFFVKLPWLSQSNST